jgi:S-adenosylmethionine:tRNA ribosyltransferase-isomerase
MRTSDFDYELPDSMIAQTPMEPRDASRLLVLHRDSGYIENRVFHEIGEYLHSGDVLVLNQTRVMPARLFARKTTGGRVELLLLRRIDPLTWRTLVGGTNLSVGKRIDIEQGPQAQVVDELGGAERVVQFSEPIEYFFNRAGNIPLPPYIHKKLADPERYQTVYSHDLGSAAAPTAGLHFTPQLLRQLEQKGVMLGYVTLHVGLDTFTPVTETEAEHHQIHSEWYELSMETTKLLNRARESNKRIIAVGTTTVRTLETVVNQSQSEGSPEIVPHSGDTDLFILPGYQFRLVDGLVTNFHLPKSTLLMLVSAFAGRERILDAYELAKREGYRFYSFGDAMLIV